MFKTFNLSSVIFFIAAVLIFNGFFFSEYIMPLHWILTGAIALIILFVTFYRLNKIWEKISSRLFLKKIFRFSLVINLITVGFVYLICYLYDGTFFEPRAADSALYHEHGIDLANNFRNNDYNVAKYLSGNDYSDFGYNVFLGVVYYVFGPYTLVARLFNVLFFALTVKAIFTLTEIIYDTRTAKTASLITACSPLLLFFIGTNLKETIMIYLLINASLYSIKILLKQENSFKNYAFLITSIMLLFFFRTVLGMIFLMSFIVFYYLNLTVKKNIYKILAIIGLFISVSFIIYYLDSIGITQKVIETYDQSGTQTDAELNDKVSKGGSSGLSIKKALIVPLLFISVLIAPFSTLVFLDDQVESAWMFSGALMKNILVFYAFFGIWYSIKYVRKRSSLLISILAAYLLVMAVSAQSTSIRYQLVALPFINIFVAFGMHNLNVDKKNLWYIYLFFTFFAIFAWNYFKLSIRNLI